MDLQFSVSSRSFLQKRIVPSPSPQQNHGCQLPRMGPSPPLPTCPLALPPTPFKTAAPRCRGRGTRKTSFFCILLTSVPGGGICTSLQTRSSLVASVLLYELSIFFVNCLRNVFTAVDSKLAVFLQPSFSLFWDVGTFPIF